MDIYNENAYTMNQIKRLFFLLGFSDLLIKIFPAIFLVATFFDSSIKDFSIIAVVLSGIQYVILKAVYRYMVRTGKAKDILYISSQSIKYVKFDKTECMDIDYMDVDYIVKKNNFLNIYLKKPVMNSIFFTHFKNTYATIEDKEDIIYDGLYQQVGWRGKLKEQKTLDK